MTDRYLRLLRAGIRHKSAVALAQAGFDVIDWWPLGWSSRPGLSFFEPRPCNSSPVLSGGGS